MTFLNEMASAGSTTTNNVIINSISEGSVIVNSQINSNSASNQGSNLGNTLHNGGTIAGMTIQSVQIVTNGANNNGNSGLSQQTIIILAVVIPVGVVRTFVVI
jgi:hypothetical protein